LLGGFSGNINPGGFSSPNGVFTLRFKSDALQNAPGWKAVYHNGSLGMHEKNPERMASFTIFPNPARDYVNVVMTSEEVYDKLYMFDFTGRIVFSKDLTGNDPGQQLFEIDLSDLPEGIYTIEFIKYPCKSVAFVFIRVP
jgi:hypothetical protein